MAAVRRLLVDFRLEEYTASFEEQGFDDLQYMRELGVEKLQGALREMVKMKPGHAMKFALWLIEGKQR